MNGVARFPKQRVSYKEKSADDFKWGKDTINYLCTYSTENNGYYYSDQQETEYKDYVNSYNQKLSNYQLYNNILNQKDFERECNPLGVDVGQFKDEIKPYNKSYNKIQVILGEELKRPINYRCTIINSEGIKNKEMIKTHKLKHWIENQVQKYTMDLQMQLHGQVPEPELQKHIEEESQQLIPPNQINKWYSTSYQDALEIAGSKLMKYLMIKLDIKDKKNDSFKHALISGDELLWVGVKKDEPVVEVVNPLNAFFHKSPETKYIQDGLYAGTKYYMTVSDILDTYSDYLMDEDVLKLEDMYYGNGNGDYRDGFTGGATYGHDGPDDVNTQMRNNRMITKGSYGNDYKHDLLVTHVEWKSQREVGFLKYMNEFNEEQVDLVDESFIVPSYAKKEKTREYGKTITKYTWTDLLTQSIHELEWKWIPQVWEGVRIGYNIYCCIQPKKNQYFSIDHPYESKLGYFGCVYNNMNANSVSLMDRMKPFQYLYFIVAHKLKTLIARDRGKLFHFDVSMIPKELGLEKTMYYLQEMDIDFFNPLQNAESPGSSQRGKVTSATDRSNMQHILNYIALLNDIDVQIGDVAGIPKQREGQTSAQQAVTNAQSDLIQSSTVTEIYFHIHNRVWEDALNALLSTALKAYKKNNRLIQYVTDDLSTEVINMTDLNVENKELGLFITDSIKENTIFTSLQQWAQALIQNDKANFSHLISILQSDSIAELKRDIKVYEEERDQQAQQQNQAGLEANQKLAEYTRETQLMLKDKDYEREIAKAEITTFMLAKDQDVNDNNIPDFLEIEKLKHAKDAKDKELGLKNKELEIKREEIASKEKIARIKSVKSK